MHGSTPRSSPDGFPSTRRSVVVGLCGSDAGARREALEEFANDYRPSLHGYLRRRHRHTPDAIDDLLQSFFLHLQERDLLARFDPSRGRFRGYLRVLLDRWMIDAHRSRQRLRRGGGAVHEAIDDHDALLAVEDADPDRVFREEWVRQLFRLALDDLERDARNSGRALQWEVFDRYDVRPETEGTRPTYTELAESLGIPTTKVTNDLHAARRRFRQMLLARLRDVCRDEVEWREEARELLGIDVP